MPDITQFRGILPPAGQTFIPPPSKASPGGLILNALHPLRDELDMALASGDQNRALSIAYAALSRAADTLAAMRGDRIPFGQVLIHALLVQLTTLPLETHFDGTLHESGTLVEVNYRNWTVNRDDAATWAEQLMARFQTLWPGAWIVVSG